MSFLKKTGDIAYNISPASNVMGTVRDFSNAPGGWTHAFSNPGTYGNLAMDALDLTGAGEALGALKGGASLGRAAFKGTKALFKGKTAAGTATKTSLQGLNIAGSLMEGGKQPVQQLKYDANGNSLIPGTAPYKQSSIFTNPLANLPQNLAANTKPMSTPTTPAIALDPSIAAYYCQQKLLAKSQLQAAQSNLNAQLTQQKKSAAQQTQANYNDITAGQHDLASSLAQSGLEEAPATYGAGAAGFQQAGNLANTQVQANLAQNVNDINLAKVNAGLQAKSAFNEANYGLGTAQAQAAQQQGAQGLNMSAQNLQTLIALLNGNNPGYIGGNQ